MYMMFFHMWKEINVMFICSVLIFFYLSTYLCIHSLAFISGGVVCLFCSFIYYLLLSIHLFIDAFIIY